MRDSLHKYMHKQTYTHHKKIRRAPYVMFGVTYSVSCLRNWLPAHTHTHTHTRTQTNKHSPHDIHRAPRPLFGVLLAQQPATERRRGRIGRCVWFMYQVYDVWLHMCMCVCVYTYIHTNSTHTYTQTHTHTHIYTHINLRTYCFGFAVFCNRNPQSRSLVR